MRGRVWTWMRAATGGFVRSEGMVVLLAASVALNVVQSQRLRAASSHPPEPSIVGSRVPELDVTAADAAPVSVRFAASERPTIVYYFSPTCVWCERNWKSIAALEKSTRGRFRFYAVTTAGDDARRAQAARFPVPTYWKLSDSDRLAYRFSGTPHTLVISPDGKVLQSWAGAYSRAVKAEMEQFFHVELPDLSAQP